MGPTDHVQDGVVSQPVRKRGLWLGVAILLVFAFGVVGSCVACEHLFDSREADWESVSIPTSATDSFTFRRRSSHPFLAEYVRFIDFADGTTAELRQHTGGKPTINVYQYYAADPKVILMLDHEGGYLLDLSTQRVLKQVWPSELTATFKQAPARFIGRIEGYTGELRFVAADVEPEFAIPGEPDPWGRKLPEAPSEKPPANQASNG